MAIKRYLHSINTSLRLIIHPPTVGVVDSFIYLFTCFITSLLLVPYCVITKNTIRKGLTALFPRIMLKNLTVSFRGCLYETRKGKVDILLLSGVSEDYLDSHFQTQEGDIIIDCGSHVGKYTLPFSKAVGHSGKVIAFEPDKNNYNALLNNIRRNGCTNVDTFNIAVFSHNGEMTLYHSTDDAGYTLLNIHDEQFVNVKKEHKGTQVPVRTIDSIFEDLGISRCDFLKIDVEGAEVEVLRGAKGVISKSPSLRVFVEVRHDHEYEVDIILRERFSKCELLGTSKYYSEKLYSINSR